MRKNFNFALNLETNINVNDKQKYIEVLQNGKNQRIKIKYTDIHNLFIAIYHSLNNDVYKMLKVACKQLNISEPYFYQAIKGFDKIAFTQRCNFYQRLLTILNMNPLLFTYSVSVSPPIYDSNEKEKVKNSKKQKLLIKEKVFYEVDQYTYDCLKNIVDELYDVEKKQYKSIDPTKYTALGSFIILINVVMQELPEFVIDVKKINQEIDDQEIEQDEYDHVQLDDSDPIDVDID